MDVSSLHTSLSLLFVFLLLAFGIFFPRRRRYGNLPPSPPAVPIIGHLHLLKQPVHRSLQLLSQKYGPIFSLRLGSQLAVIVSSPSAVEECFTKNDVVLANRPRFASGKYVGYNYTTIGAASYGDHWRNLRRLSALEIFSSNRLNMFLGIRRDEVKRLLLRLARDSREGFAKVEMRPMLTELTFNIITRMVAGKRYYGEDVEYTEAKRFREIISQLFILGGASSNPADFLPILRWIGLGYHEKKLKKIVRETRAILQGLIDEHRSGNDKGSVDNNSMIDHLLSLQKTEPEYYTDDIIKGLVQVLILAGTDTSAATMEWAMTLLLNHPDVLEKAKAELDMHVGKDRLIEESDLPKLRYLRSIISETLRVFPVAPLLLPHMSSDDCQIGGFDIPRGTLLLVNVWALHRDPQVWEDPTSFKPERFENGERENYKLVPFGIGRRACPGAGLAQRVVGLALGSLIQCYDWKKISNTAIDTIEGKGLTMPKLQPLEAMCKAREIINEVHLN
ncbi:cytochrome P450 81Q32 [Vitis vinifera]|uniref:Isoflavone 2'-hydroxylase n=2 Tax=Vitis vinifera TaxID=29760 RepID=A0A438FBU1_VITVI|nr:cytochrome P450 81Q32 [Vitis vinifera]RVW57449.1 Isoflavone 2'-hydroxylase [Vitis vinifera]|eukprot:XP_002283500.1 PREDICTED: isoflavone 3'-hydroxylase [Vitis vinifera]